jgi:hypothetical protein
MSRGVRRVWQVLPISARTRAPLEFHFQRLRPSAPPHVEKRLSPLSVLQADKPLLKVLAVTIAAAWLLTSFWNQPGLSSDYRIQLSTGMKLAEYQRFLFFYVHKDLFPVASVAPIPADTTEVADLLLRDVGNSIVMELANTIRAGDNGKIWLLLPDYWLFGETLTATPRLANAGLFTIAIVVLLINLLRVRQYILAFFLVVFLGSNPFQLFEIVANPNVFGLPISIFILMTGLHIPVIFNDRAPSWVKVVLLALGSGVLLATVKEIRTEPVIIAAPLLLVYMTIPKAAVKMRSLAVGLFVCALLVTSSLWGRYWDSKLKEATEVVASVGGHVLPDGIRQAHHELWHPIWCGLGDFGTDRGFKWLDTAAYAQVVPILKSDFGITVNWSGGYFLDDFYDESRVYRKKISEIPEYHQVIKGIVQDAIGNDPIWYAGILWKRFNRILTDQTPIRIGLGALTILAFTYHGSLAILLLLGTVRWRRWPETKLLMLSAAPSLTPLLIFSGKGATYYSCYHIVAAAIGIAMTIEYLRKQLPGPSGGADTSVA